MTEKHVPMKPNPSRPTPSGLLSSWRLPVLVLITAGLFRLWIALNSLQNGLLWDELNTLAIAQLPLNELFHVLSIRDFHPSASHLLVHLWTMVAGGSDLSIRVLGWLLAITGLFFCWKLALAFFRHRKTAALVTLICALSPMLIRYTTMTTGYTLQFTSGLISWYCLFRLLSPSRSSDDDNYSASDSFASARSMRQPWVYIGGYFIATLVSAHAAATSLLILPAQACYLLRQQTTPFRLIAFNGQRRLSLWISLLVVGLSLIPYGLAVLQTEHMSHAHGLQRIHPYAQPVELLMLPAQWLFLGWDFNHLNWLGHWPELLPQLLLSLLIFWGGLLLMLRKEPDITRNTPLLEMGFAPLLAAGLGSLFLGLPIFQLRAQLLAVFSAACLSAWLLARLLQQPRPAAAKLLVGIVLLFQLFSPYQHHFPNEGLKTHAESLKSVFQPGDGIIIYPADSHLSIMRYFKPDEFGLTERERHVNPAEENVFHMVYRIDDRDFWIAGQSVLEQPETQAALRRFLTSRPRIFYIGNVELMLPYLNCRSNVLALDVQGQWIPFPCLPMQPLLPGRK